jgi:WhiB family transcriptional regulator, redox-sensing transcriptional regulator
MRKNAAGNTEVRLLAQVVPKLAEAELGEWTAHAICTDADPEIFLPPPGKPSAVARQICSRCPVWADCLAYALAAEEEFGIWGGLDQDERRNLKRRLRRKKASSPPGKEGAA